VEALRKAINEGADLYNAGFHGDCAAYFRGVLTSLPLSLEPYPGLQREIARSLEEAKTRGSGSDQAWALRGVLEKVRSRLAYRMPRMGEGNTLWERLGGEKGVGHIVDDLIEAALADPQVNFFRGGKFKMTPDQVAQMKRRLVTLTSAVGGGPLKYEGRSMKKVHEGMGITEEEFDALLAHLTKALLRNQVRPADVAALREMIALTRPDIVGKRPADSTREGATLWERMGEEKGVARIVDDFVEAISADPRVNFFRRGKFPNGPEQVAQIKKHFVALASALSNGPLKYEGRSMKTIHETMNITEEEFDALLAHLKIVLARHGVRAEDAAVVVKAVASTRKDIVRRQTD
jgi:hemoglobin